MSSKRAAVLRFVKLTANALTPTKASPKAAGFDLKSAYEATVPARGNEVIKTDLQIKLPPGCYGRIAPRSGLALQHHISVGAGVVDEHYRGNLCVILFNHSEKPFNVSRGDRIAQLICELIIYPKLEEVNELDDAKFGKGGFGSAGPPI